MNKLNLGLLGIGLILMIFLSFIYDFNNKYTILLEEIEFLKDMVQDIDDDLHNIE